MKKVQAYLDATGSDCDTFSACDPYVKLYIDGNEINSTGVLSGTSLFNADLTYSKWYRIPKTTMIKIKVWDSDSLPLDDDDLIQETEGNIDSFLTEPIRKGVQREDKQNFIETVTIWRYKPSY